jgi:hypothetical protein
MFGIEHFCGKLNGHRTLPKMLHSNIAARERRSFAGFDPPTGLRQRQGGFKMDFRKRPAASRLSLQGPEIYKTISAA